MTHLSTSSQTGLSLHSRDSFAIETLNMYMALLQNHYPDASGQFNSLLTFLQLGIKTIANRLQGRKLEALMNSFSFWKYDPDRLSSILSDEFVTTLTNSGCVHELINSLNDEIITVETHKQGKYIVCFQVLSSDGHNIDADLPVGTTFSIYKKASKFEDENYLSGPSLANLREEYIVAAGYAVYSADVQLVLGIKNIGVSSYVLDSVLGEFIVLQKQMKIPQKAKIISVNEGFTSLWEPQVLEYVKRKRDPKIGRPLKSRYIGCLPADFHRILLSGGIFLYPPNRKKPQGKHHLICECVPLAFVVHLSGGAATTGKSNILSINPDKVKQFVPFFIGSGEEVYELIHVLTSNP